MTEVIVQHAHASCTHKWSAHLSLQLAGGEILLHVFKGMEQRGLKEELAQLLKKQVLLLKWERT